MTDNFLSSPDPLPKKSATISTSESLANAPKNHIDFYRQQHKLRLSYMPWLYASLKPAHREWAEAWQLEIQNYLQSVETIHIGKNCFIAPEAKLFAEPGRTIVIGDNCFIAADAVIHGPVTLGESVSINHHVTMDGGSKGIYIGNNTRIAAYCQLYAFNHGLLAEKLISSQPIQSIGIHIGEDVWLGANVGIVDGIRIADHAVVGMGSQVTRDVSEYKIVAGNPAKIIGDRREKTDL